MTRKVLVDVRHATWAPELGISRSSRNLVRAMLAQDAPDLHIVPLDVEEGTRWPGVEVETVRGGLGLPKRPLQEQVHMTRAAARADLLHLPWHEGPARPRCPLVLTVYDLATLEQRHGYSWRYRAYYNTLLRLQIRRARRVIVPSHTTLEALERRWPKRHYVVVYLGVDPVFERGTSAGPVPEDPPFILYTGGFDHRKRLPDLLEAFDRVAEADADVRLVLTGGISAAISKDLEARAASNRIVATGRVSDRELVDLYGRAAVVAYPSALEGFGMPVVEAFASRAPVVATRAGSIPEIAGGAALLVEPYRPDELAGALLAVLRDAALADRLRAAGAERSRHFRWAEAARQTLDVYREALQ